MAIRSVFAFFFITFFLVPFVQAYEEPMLSITVREGDTLIGICLQYLEEPGRWREVARVNQLRDPDRINPDQTIVIPAHLVKGIPLHGRVNYLQGTVEIQPQDSREWLPLLINSQVPEGSRVRTGEGSGAEIMFDDGHLFFQKAHTTAVFQYAKRKLDRFAFYKVFLEMGRTMTNIKEATGKESRFLIDTPSALCAVRGTLFRASVDQDATRSEVLKGLLDVEAVGERVKVSEGEGTIARKGKPPLRPRKLLPPPAPLALQETYNAMPLRISFAEVRGAESYRAILAKDNEFREIVLEHVHALDEPFFIPFLEDGAYFLQSLSIDDLGLEGIPSEAFAIRVRINPEPPILLARRDMNCLAPEELQFEWLMVEDAVRYHVQIAEDSAFQRIMVDRADITGTSFAPLHLGDHLYYFRIRSVAADSYEGAWSDVLTFTVRGEQSQ
ncbi:MAG: FecR domain-containing protein [Nitrospirota bacterium]